MAHRWQPPASTTPPRRRQKERRQRLIALGRCVKCCRKRDHAGPGGSVVHCAPCAAEAVEAADAAREAYAERHGIEPRQMTTGKGGRSVVAR